MEVGPFLAVLTSQSFPCCPFLPFLAILTSPSFPPSHFLASYTFLPCCLLLAVLSFPSFLFFAYRPLSLNCSMVRRKVGGCSLSIIILDILFSLSIFSLFRVIFIGPDTVPSVISCSAADLPFLRSMCSTIFVHLLLSWRKS